MAAEENGVDQQRRERTKVASEGGGVADWQARERVEVVSAQLGELRAVLAERERNAARMAEEREKYEARRWQEARDAIQGIISRIEDGVRLSQSSYRDGFDTLTRRTEQTIRDIRGEFTEELKMMIKAVGESQDSHNAEDKEKFDKIERWQWKAVYALMFIMVTVIFALIGVIWGVVPHHP